MVLNRRLLGILVLLCTILWATHRQVSTSVGINRRAIQEVDAKYVSTILGRDAADISDWEQQHSHELNVSNLDLQPRDARDTDYGPASTKTYGVPWFIEQFRVRGEQAILWLGLGVSHAHFSAVTDAELRKGGWREVLAVNNDAGIQSAWQHHRPAPNSDAGYSAVSTQKRQEYFENALRWLQPTIPHWGAFPPAWQTYWDKKNGGHLVGGATCVNDYEAGYIWNIHSHGDGRLRSEWTQVAYWQWRQPLERNSVPWVSIGTAEEKLNNVAFVRVNDVQTLTVVFWILSNWDVPLIYAEKVIPDIGMFNLVPSWDASRDSGRKIVLSDTGKTRRKALAALLGTPTGLAAVELLGSQRIRLGARSPKSVTIFKDQKCPDITQLHLPECRPTLVFKFQTIRKSLSKPPPNTDLGFPDGIPCGLDPQNPYVSLASGKRPGDAQWRNYYKAAANGQLDENGVPTQHQWGSGPKEPPSYYRASDMGHSADRNGFLRNARYALPGSNQAAPGPQAGVIYNANTATAGPSNAQGAGQGGNNDDQDGHDDGEDDSGGDPMHVDNSPHNDLYDSPSDGDNQEDNTGPSTQQV